MLPSTAVLYLSTSRRTKRGTNLKHKIVTSSYSSFAVKGGFCACTVHDCYCCAAMMRRMCGAGGRPCPATWSRARAVPADSRSRDARTPGRSGCGASTGSTLTPSRMTPLPLERTNKRQACRRPPSGGRKADVGSCNGSWFSAGTKLEACIPGQRVLYSL